MGGEGQRSGSIKNECFSESTAEEESLLTPVSLRKKEKTVSLHKRFSVLLDEFEEKGKSLKEERKRLRKLERKKIEMEQVRLEQQRRAVRENLRSSKNGGEGHPLLHPKKDLSKDRIVKDLVQRTRKSQKKQQKERRKTISERRATLCRT